MVFVGIAWSAQGANPPAASQPTTIAVAPADTVAPADERLWTEMQEIDARSAKITSITATFEQRKFTPLLKKPLTSRGRVAAKGDTALWTTETPQPTSMAVSSREIRIFYPRQQTVEVYPVQGQLGALAASPLPRLATLKQFFSFQRDSAGSLDKNSDDKDCLAVALTPTDAQLSQHVKQVRVLLDRSTGVVRLAETTDTDGDRTVLIFSDVKLDAVIGDDAMKLKLPDGTKEVHPLEGLGDAPPKEQPAQAKPAGQQ